MPTNYYALAVRDKETAPERLVMFPPTDDYSIASERLATMKLYQTTSDPKRYRVVRLSWVEVDANEVKSCKNE